MSDWNLPTDVETTSTERVGGKGFIWESGVYKTKVQLVYLNQVRSGAISFNIVLKGEDGRDLKESLWIKSGDTKGNKTYYEKDGKKFPLPGYSTADSLCVAATGKHLPEIMNSSEKKMVNIYSYEAKKEVPTERPVLMDLRDQTVTVAVREILEDKNIKNDAGEYVPSGETRSKNECAFFGNAEGKSADEILAGRDAVIFDKWAEKNTGEVIDKSKATKQATAPTGTAVNTPTTTSSMFS